MRVFGGTRKRQSKGSRELSRGRRRRVRSNQHGRVGSIHVVPPALCSTRRAAADNPIPACEYVLGYTPRPRLRAGAGVLSRSPSSDQPAWPTWRTKQIGPSGRRECPRRKVVEEAPTIVLEHWRRAIHAIHELNSQLPAASASDRQQAVVGIKSTLCDSP